MFKLFRLELLKILCSKFRLSRLDDFRDRESKETSLILENEKLVSFNDEFFNNKSVMLECLNFELSRLPSMN